MKKIVTLFLLLLSFGLAKADLGIPAIQAVCKVTLKDGTSVEGMITFGAGGYYYHYRPHGFCFIHDMGAVSLKLYGFDFRGFQPDRFQAYHDGNARLYYIQNKNLQNAPETSYSLIDSTRTLRRSTLDQDDFLMMDEMLMFKTLPLSMYLDPGQSDETAEVWVKVSEIKSVEILENPDKAWLDLIKEARSRHAKEAEEGEDYLEPLWYHEIIGDEEMVTELKKYF